MEQRLKVIGVGPGSEEYLTSIAKIKIEEAEVLIAGERVLAHFGQPNQEKLAIKNNLREVVAYAREAKKTKNVVLLASGDPGMYGILNFLLKYFEKDELEVIPGISSLQIAAAKLKTSWHDSVIYSVHGRPLEGLDIIVGNNSKVFILTDPKTNPASIASFLLAKGIEGKKATVCANISYPTEVIKSYTLTALANATQYQGCVLLIEEGEANA